MIYSTQNQSYNIIFKGLNLKQSHRVKEQNRQKGSDENREDKRRNDK